MTENRYCPPPGSSLPPPTNIASFPPIPDFESTLSLQPWFNATTIAIKASIGGTPIFQYAHRAGNNGTCESLYDTKIRVASVTKLFTVLAVLLSNATIGWEDNITKYVPGLDEHAYNDVTISALAGQTSGLGRAGYVGDLSLIPGFSPSDLGLPNITHGLPGCDAFPGGVVCSKPQVLDMFNDTAYHPTSPNSGPIYSNIAYNLLGMALSNVYSKPYEKVIDDLIFTPIGMQNSSFEIPDSDTGILPGENDQWFAAPFGNFNPSGGIWSTPNDMLLFLEVLQSHKLLSPPQTRKWLQPSSLLPSLSQLVGAPWEIFRPTDIEVGVPRPIDMYTKAGGVTGYASYAVLVPEYGIAMTIHAAGDGAEAVVQSLLPLVTKPLIAHADAQARVQANVKYSGTYHSPEGNSSNSIVLAVGNGPGLVVKSAVMNGVAIIPTLASMQGLDPANATARLYPTDIDSMGSEKEAWSMSLNRVKPGAERGFADQTCQSWVWGDAARYAGQPLDRVVFHMDKNEAVGIELLGWRTTLTKRH